MSLLSVVLNVEFRSGTRVLSDVEFSLDPGEIVGIAGRSGSGKSTLAMALLGLLDSRTTRINGRILFGDVDLLQLSERRLRSIRGRRISLVLQAAASALNPHVRIVDHVREAWLAHRSDDWTAGRTTVIETLRAIDVDCDEDFLCRYPGQISVGQAQRVLIAMAVLHNPAVLVTDEPTSALDPIAATEVTRLLRRVSTELKMAIVYISHDLASVAQLCDRVIVLEAGRIIEQGSTVSVLANPATIYVKQLVRAIRGTHGNSDLSNMSAGHSYRV